MPSSGKVDSSASAADDANSSRGMGGIGRIGCGCKMGRRLDECRIAPGARPNGIAFAREEDECWYNVVVELELSWVCEEL